MSKRSQILVDPSVQWAVARRILTHWGLFLGSLLVVGVAVRMLMTLGSESFGTALVSAVLAQLPIVAVMLLLLPIFLRDTMRMSNRFAGPMYRLRMELRKVAQGKNAREIHFRNNDFWHDAATEFNLVLKRLHALEEENELLRSQVRTDRELVNS